MAAFVHESMRFGEGEKVLTLLFRIHVHLRHLLLRCSPVSSSETNLGSKWQKTIRMRLSVLNGTVHTLELASTWRCVWFVLPDACRWGKWKFLHKIIC